MEHIIKRMGHTSVMHAASILSVTNVCLSVCHVMWDTVELHFNYRVD